MIRMVPILITVALLLMPVSVWGSLSPEGLTVSTAQPCCVSPALKLCLSQEGKVLVLTVVNVASQPVSVDRELLYFVDIDIYDEAGEYLAEFSEKEVRQESLDINTRLIRLAPGQVLKRRIELDGPIRYFGTVQAVGGLDYSYESNFRLRNGSVPVYATLEWTHRQFAGLVIIYGREAIPTDLVMEACDCKLKLEPFVVRGTAGDKKPVRKTKVLNPAQIKEAPSKNTR